MRIKKSIINLFKKRPSNNVVLDSFGKRPNEVNLNALDRLPNEIQQYILSFCQPNDLLRARCVCSHWKELIDTDYLWGVVAETLFGKRPALLDGETLQDICILHDPLFTQKRDISGNQTIPYTLYRDVFDFDMKELNNIDLSKITVGRFKAELINRHTECEKDQFEVCSEKGCLTEDHMYFIELFPDGNLKDLAINITKMSKSIP